MFGRRDSSTRSRLLLAVLASCLIQLLFVTDVQSRECQDSGSDGGCVADGGTTFVWGIHVLVSGPVVEVNASGSEPGFVEIAGFRPSWEATNFTAKITLYRTQGSLWFMVWKEFNEQDSVQPTGVPPGFDVGLTKTVLDPTQVSFGTLDPQTKHITFTLHTLATNSMFKSGTPIRVTTVQNGNFTGSLDGQKIDIDAKTDGSIHLDLPFAPAVRKGINLVGSPSVVFIVGLVLGAVLALVYFGYFRRRRPV